MWSFISILSLLLYSFSSTVVGSPVDHSSPLVRRDTSARGTITFSYPSPNVTKATFNNGPINLIDRAFESDILDFLHSLENVTESTPKVVIFDSSNPDFYLGHVDLTSLETPITEAKTQMGEDYVTMTRLLQNITSTIFIAEINGRAFGAGQEIAAQMDMRFVGPNARTGSFEEALGLIAGGGGQTFLGSIIGKGRALEYLLAAKTFDGPTGERLGLFNKYYDDAVTLTMAVENLAERIALFPRAALNQTKSVLSYLNPPIKALDDDVEAFYNIEPMAVEQANIRKVIELSNNQTAGAFELGLGDSLLGLYGKWDGAITK